MGSPRLKDARRVLLSRQNLAADEESAGQTGGLCVESTCLCWFGEVAGLERLFQEPIGFHDVFASYFVLYNR